MYAQPIQGRGGITTIASAFGDKGLWPWKEDPVAADDATEIWWDRRARGEDELGNAGNGLYRYVSGGKRYLPTEWPKGAPKAFVPAGTVTIYSKPPPPRRVAVLSVAGHEEDGPLLRQRFTQGRPSVGAVRRADRRASSRWRGASTAAACRARGRTARRR